MSRNDRSFVASTLRLLAGAGIDAWIFGGWAEELRGLISSRPHRDLDLLYPAADFDRVDKLLARGHDLDEITAKHFPHKRAFERKSIMVELFLVAGNAEDGYHTDFWASRRCRWRSDTFDPAAVDGLPVASAASVQHYRRHYAELAAPGAPRTG